MILKNTSGQGVYLFASNKTTGVGLAGDHANITGSISKDGAVEAAFSTANPTNIGGGLYWQPLSQAETNCNAFGLRWVSSTTDILVDPLVGFTDQGRLDATISSRMATFTYTAPSTPPTPAAIRTEMDANSTRLANLDATMTSRASQSSVNAVGATLAGTLDVNVIEVAGEAVTVMEFTEATTDELAVAVRDVNNTTPALNSLGAAVNAAAIGGGGDTKEEIAVAVWDAAPSGTPLADIAGAVVDAMDADSTQMAKLDGIVTTTNGIQSSLAAGVIASQVNDKTGYALSPSGVTAAQAGLATATGTVNATLVATGLDAIPTTLSGPRSGWKFPQWMMFKGLKLGRSRKVKSSGAISIYDAATQATVIYTQTTAETDTEQTVGPPT